MASPLVQESATALLTLSGFQDHNYGAPPPSSPPQTPSSPGKSVANGRITIGKKKPLHSAKPLKVNKSLAERRTKPVANGGGKRQVGVRRRNSAPIGNKSAVVKAGEVDAVVVEPVVNVVEEVAEEEEEPGAVGIGGDYTDSITRCICNFTHDDGYMICCDQCQ